MRSFPGRGGRLVAPTKCLKMGRGDGKTSRERGINLKKKLAAVGPLS